MVVAGAVEDYTTEIKLFLAGKIANAAGGINLGIFPSSVVIHVTPASAKLTATISLGYDADKALAVGGAGTDPDHHLVAGVADEDVGRVEH